MKLSFERELKSLEYDCRISRSYDAWNDIVGRKLYDMADGVLSSAKLKLGNILRKLEQNECDPEIDLKWIEDRLENLK